MRALITQSSTKSKGARFSILLMRMVGVITIRFEVGDNTTLVTKKIEINSERHT